MNIGGQQNIQPIELKLVSWPDERLTKKCKEVEIFNEEAFKNLLSAAKQALDVFKGVGLAANQIGFDERFFFANIEFEDDGRYFDGTNMFINPVILTQSNFRFETKREGCLSVPGYWPKIKRYKMVKLTWQNETGESFTKDFSGLDARIVQHEIDHISGKCIASNLIGEK